MRRLLLSWFSTLGFSRVRQQVMRSRDPSQELKDPGEAAPGRAGSLRGQGRAWLFFATMVVCAGVVAWWAGRGLWNPDADSGPASAGDASLADPAMESIRHEALNVARRVVTRFPNSPDAICLMGLVHHRYGSSDQAVACWRQCLTLDPGYADAYLCLGRHALERGDYGEAAKQMRTALAIDPTTPDVRLLLADALMGMGKMEEAITLLEQHLATSPDSVEGLFRLGQAYLHRQQYEKARACHERAVRIDPDGKRAYYGLATACARLGDQEKAAEYREKFEAIQAEQSPPAKGRRLAYDDLATMRQGLVDTYLAAARVYAAHGDSEQAQQHRRQAAALDAKHAGDSTETQR